MPKEFWATSKSAKIMQLSGWVFILVLPVYGVTKLGLMNRPGFPRHSPSSGNNAFQTPLATAA